MKTKIFTFLGLILASIGALSLLQSSPVFAAGERYVWVTPNTIEGTGGGLTGLGKPLVFNRQPNNTYKALSNGGNSSLFFNCPGITWILTVGADSSTATLTISAPVSTTCDSKVLQAVADKTVKIDNVANAPPMEGQDVDYRTVNCSTYYDGGTAVTRCLAVQSCVKEHNLAVLDCLRSWHTCTIINTTNIQRCVDAVTAGNLAEAIKGGITATPEPEAKTSNCRIEAIGWLVCPVLNFMSLLIDKAYGFISDTLLKVEPLSIVTNDSNPIFKAWSLMRNFANIVFVIAFLLIIYSQVTSTGISNYGIKKLLPKVILAAGLVNMSYWLCAGGVDISNIAQSSIYNFFKSLQATLATPNIGGASTGEGWAGVVGFLLAGAGGVAVAMYVGLAALIPVLITVGLSILSVILLLIVRQALIIILIILSPLAFVSILLPNTDGIFKLWWKGSKMVFVVGPFLGLIFGGSALASTVIMASSNDIGVQIIGAAVAVIPAGFSWIVTQLTGKLGKLGAALNLNNPNKGPIDSLRKKAEGFAGRRNEIMNTRRLNRSKGMLEGGDGVLGSQGSRRRRTAAWLAGAGASAALNRTQRDTSAKRALHEAQQDYVMERVAGQAGNNGAGQRYAQSIAGATGDAAKVMAAAVAGIAEEFAKEVKAQKASMSRTAVTELVKVVNDPNASAERRSAAASHIVERGGDEDIHKLLDNLGTAQARPGDEKEAEALRSMKQQVGGDLGSRKPLAIGGKDLAALKDGTYSGGFTSKLADRLQSGKISAESVANGTTDELKAINKYLTANQATLQGNTNLEELADDLRKYTQSPNYAPKSPESAKHINDIKGLF